MPIPIMQILTIIRTVGGIYSTYRLANKGLDALQNGENKDYVDVVGNETVRNEHPEDHVGITMTRITVQHQIIPEEPRGQFIMECLVRLNRDAKAPQGWVFEPGHTSDPVLMPVHLELQPIWNHSANPGGTSGTIHGPNIDLNTCNIEVLMPPGEAIVNFFIVVDGAQGFQYSQDQRFSLRAKILSPNRKNAWTETNKDYHSTCTAGPVWIDFDYFHLPWE